MVSQNLTIAKFSYDMLAKFSYDAPTAFLSFDGAFSFLVAHLLAIFWFVPPSAGHFGSRANFF